MGIKQEKAELFYTDDLSVFKFASENRVIYPRHVTRMAKSLQEYGYIKDYPLRVLAENGKYLITDGQHRLEAARAVKCGVFFTVSKSTTMAEDITAAHAFTRGWTLDDFLHHFVTRKIGAYVLLEKFCKKYRIPVSSALALIIRGVKKGEGIKGGTEAYRMGKLEFAQEDYVRIGDLMTQVNEVRFFHERLERLQGDKAFIRALIYMMRVPTYEHARFMKHLEVNIGGISPASNMDQYLAALDWIYNYKQGYKSRVKLTRK